jgi:lysyl-tRNA synthetase class 1
VRGAVVDLSQAAQTKRLSQLDAVQKKLAALKPESLSAEDRIDFAILQDGIALERVYLTEIHEWTWSPRLNDSFPFYDPREIVASRLADLIHGTWGKEPARRIATVDAPWITALAVRADDTLLAGTTPGARIFVVNPRTGGTKELAKLPADASAEDIQTQVFEIGKRHPFESLRHWFQALYETLLGSSQGPRMGSFIALYGIDNSRKLIAEALG